MENATTKAALFFIALGLLVLSYGLYEYTRPYSSPERPFTPVTTTTRMQLSNATSWSFEVSTTRGGYVPRGVISTWVVATTSVPPTSTTTLVPPSCINEQLDPDETYVDCGMQCGSCVLMELSTSWRRYLDENLWLMYDGSTVSQLAGGPCRGVNWTDQKDRPVELLHYCRDKVFRLSVSSTENTPDHREMRLDDVEYIDGFEVKLIEDLNETVYVYVKRDFSVIPLISEYVVLTVGGVNCVSNNTGFCRRHWNGYTFSLRMRETDAVWMDLTTPSGKRIDNVELKKDTTTIIEGAKIGLLYPYQKGGYCTVYVKKL